MSDSRADPKHFFSTTMDDFIRFLHEKTTGRECPACGNSAWTVLGPAEGEYSYRLVTLLKDDPRRTLRLSTFALVCDNCGYLRQHMARVVRKWVEENPEAQQELDLDIDDEAEDFEQ